MKATLVRLLMLCVAALVPESVRAVRIGERVSQPDWPTHFLDAPLTQVALSEDEASFVSGFPGSVGKFQAGEATLVIRWLRHPTRRLHPARDCFKGSGFRLEFLPLSVDREGGRWSCFRAEKRGERLRVCERIFDQRGNAFTDVSEWFWKATFGASAAPWWAVTVIERA